jgi:formylglycine-generating enzyme required for sulfatase activity
MKRAALALALALAVAGAVWGTSRLRALESDDKPGTAPPARVAFPVSKPGKPYQNGTGFQACAECPQMVVIVPTGDFTIGSPKDEAGRYDDEQQFGPIHMAPYAIGRFEVTFDEWAACVSEGGCTSDTKPGDRGWGRGRRPVIAVSWNDAQEYVGWLSAKTGQKYRLPSESEWEYAARGGTRTPYSWRSQRACVYANYAACAVGKTLEVGSLRPNGFGLYDTGGNVWEWVQDCYKDFYDPVIKDGRAYEEEGACGKRVVRGGSRVNDAGDVRSANRNRSDPAYRTDDVGFRVAMTLP